jgi:hypothetical protein
MKCDVTLVVYSDRTKIRVSKRKHVLRIHLATISDYIYMYNCYHALFFIA